MLEYVHKTTRAIVRADRITYVPPAQPGEPIDLQLRGEPHAKYRVLSLPSRPTAGDYLIVQQGVQPFTMTPTEFGFCYDALPAVPADAVALHRIVTVPPMHEAAEFQRVLLQVQREGQGVGPLVVDGDWFRANAPEAGQLVAVNARTGAVTLVQRETGEVKGRVPRPEGHEQVKLSKELGEQYPRKITRDALLAMLQEPVYEVRPDGRTTVCELTFKNGFSLRGESACACASEFKAHLGQTAAFAKALDKAWEFAGFMLREDRYRAGLAS